MKKDFKKIIDQDDWILLHTIVKISDKGNLNFFCIYLLRQSEEIHWLSWGTYRDMVTSEEA